MSNPAVIQDLILRPSFETLATKYRNLFRNLASKYGVEEGDVASSAFIMYAEDDKFDPNRGEYESRFIFMLRNLIFKQYYNQDFELTEEMEEVTAEVKQEEIEEWRSDETLKNKNLGGDLNTIVKLLLNGYDFEHCAIEMGITARRVEQIAQKAMAINEDQADLFRNQA